MAHLSALQAFVKACGVRLLSKETEALSEKDTIKHLKSKLADLGMTGRLSMAKAAEIKEKRALDSACWRPFTARSKQGRVLTSATHRR